MSCFTSQCGICLFKSSIYFELGFLLLNLSGKLDKNETYVIVNFYRVKVIQQEMRVKNGYNILGRDFYWEMISIL